MGARALAPVLEQATLLLLNREEAVALTGCSDAPPKTLLAALRRLGPATVVMTDGPAGSYASAGDRFLKAEILDAPVVDRTGAGDAYSSAFTAAQMLGLPLAQSMAWGTVQAAQVVGLYGATPGLLRRHELESVVAAHPELCGAPF